MDALLKNPAWLIGAVVVGLIIFAGRSGGGGGSRLGAAIESQRIASEANVALSDITARRDVGMAAAMNERAAISAGYQINFAEALNTSRALTYAHGEALRSMSVAEKLGTLQVTAAREVAMGDQATQIRLATIAATTRESEIDLAGMIAEMSADLQHERLTLATSPSFLSHIETLATLDVDRATQLATIASQSTQAIAMISADTQRYLSSAGSRNYRSNVITNAAGNVIGQVVNGVARYFSGSSGGGGDVVTINPDLQQYDTGPSYADSGGGGDFNWGTVASLAGAALSFFSDARLKRDLIPCGSTPGGLPLYAYRYFWDAALRFGVLAQDVLDVDPDAVHLADNGYLMVDYSRVS